MHAEEEKTKHKTNLKDAKRCPVRVKGGVARVNVAVVGIKLDQARAVHLPAALFKTSGSMVAAIDVWDGSCQVFEVAAHGQDVNLRWGKRAAWRRGSCVALLHALCLEEQSLHVPPVRIVRGSCLCLKADKEKRRRGEGVCEKVRVSERR